MGREPEGKSRVTIRLDDQTLEAIRLLAEQFQSDTTDIIRRCINAGKDLLVADMDEKTLLGSPETKAKKAEVLKLIGMGCGNALAAGKANITRSMIEHWEATDAAFRQLAKDSRDYMVETTEFRLLQLAFGDNAKNNATACFGYLNARSEHYGPPTIEKQRELFHQVLELSIEAARITWGQSEQLLAFSGRLSDGIVGLLAPGPGQSKGRRRT